MRDIESVAEAMFSRAVASGFAVVDGWDDRHEAEALRAELRRLGRRFGTRIATTYQNESGRVAMVRRDEMPWDEHDEPTLTELLEGDEE